jgi:MYXO-CTERM domain-containing protein
MVRQLRPAALAAVGVLSLAAGTAQADALGYGTLIGTWKKGGSGGHAATIGQYILDLVNPDPFALSDFHFGGGTNNWLGDQTSNGSDGSGFEFSKTNGGNGSWEYHGVTAQTVPVDLFLTVKYGDNFSIFFYENVEVGDTGLLTNSHVTFDGVGGVGACASNYTREANCMAVNYSGPPSNRVAGAPPDISHVVAYWPPGDPIEEPVLNTVGTLDVPEPWGAGLVLSGLLGFAALRRRRA